MKKSTILLLFVAFSAAVAASDQAEHAHHDMKHWGVGGDLGFMWTEHLGVELAVSPEVIYEFNHTWGVGAGLHTHFLFQHGDLHHSTVALAPFARYMPCHFGVFTPFIDMGFSLGAANRDFLATVGVTPGVSFDLSPQCSLLIKCGFLGFKHVASVSQAGFMFSSENLSVGAHFRF